MGGWIFQIVGAGVNLTIAYDIVGNEFGESDRGVSIERKGFVQPDCDVPGRLTIARRSGERQFVDLSGLAVAGLIKTYARINQRVVDDDLLAQDYLAILYNCEIGPPAFGSAVGVILLAGAVTADGKGQAALAALLQFHLAGLLSPRQGDEGAPAVERVDDATKKNEKQTGVHDVNRHFRKAVALAEQREAVLAYNPLRPEPRFVQYPFGHAQRGFFVIDLNQHLMGESLAKRLVGTLIRTGKKSPCVGEALHRGGNDAEAHQSEQQYEPAGVENVGQAHAVQQAQHLWRIGALHFLGIGGGTLQNHRPGRRENDDENEQNDPSLNSAEGLPSFPGQ